jgi:hypothetical protein
MCCCPAPAGAPAGQHSCQQLDCQGLSLPYPDGQSLAQLLFLSHCLLTPSPHQEENMVSNKEIQEKYKDFNDFEDDFM